MEDFRRRGRIRELDLLRGTALCMMMVFHAFFDLYFFGGWDIHLERGLWHYFNLSIPALFLLVVGISATIKGERVRDAEGRIGFKPFLERSLIILGAAMMITAVTRALYPDYTIYFGILHLIGISVLLVPLLLERDQRTILVTGMTILSIGMILSQLRWDFFHLMWLGFHPEDLTTFDYFPIFPWFGVVLVGVWAGKTVFPGGRRSVAAGYSIDHPLTRFVETLGKNSLVVYIIHQPIIMTVLYLAGLIDPGLW